MKKMSFIFCIFCIFSVIALWGCGEGGDVNVNVNNPEPAVPTPEPAPTPTPALPGTITFGAVSGEFVESIFDSPLLQEHPNAEPNKIVGLMDEAVQIGDVLEVCWNGDIGNSWLTERYCTTSVRSADGRNFHGSIYIPNGDTGNFVAYLVPSEIGSQSWFNITNWSWPQGTKLDLVGGVATLPRQ